MVFDLGLIFLLVVINGLFASTELALVSSKRGRLEQRIEDGDMGAAAALRLQAHPIRLLSMVQIGITLIGTLSGAFGEARLAHHVVLFLAPLPVIGPFAESVALVLVVVFITYLSLVLGELVPKRLAQLHPETIATHIARPMELLSKCSRPIVTLLTWSTESILTLLGQRGGSEPGVTEEDILSLVQEGIEEGAVELHEQQIIERVFALSDHLARQIMTPRRTVYSLAADARISEVLESFLENGFSRVPVYENTVEHIVGIANIRDLLRVHASNPAARVEDAMRPPLFVPDTVYASALLSMFRRTQQHMAIVVDESGSVEGIVTLEDVLEELVGEIADEHDEEVIHPIVRRDDGSLLIDGVARIEEVKDVLNVHQLPGEEHEHFDTMAGFLLSQFGRIPELGEQVQWQEWSFEVVDMDGLRIDKVLVTKTADSPNAS